MALGTLHEFDAASDFTTLFPNAAIGNNGSERQGRWQHLSLTGGATGSSGSGQTGPASNNALSCMYTESSGGATLAQLNANGIAELATASVQAGIDRKLHLRLAVMNNNTGSGSGSGGDGFTDTDEGFFVEYSDDEPTDASPTWTEADHIVGWKYQNKALNSGSYNEVWDDASSASTDGIHVNVDGEDVTIAANGGWVDYEIDIPDSAKRIRIRPHCEGTDTLYRHDIGFRSLQWEYTEPTRALTPDWLTATGTVHMKAHIETGNYERSNDQENLWAPDDSFDQAAGTLIAGETSFTLFEGTLNAVTLTLRRVFRWDRSATDKRIGFNFTGAIGTYFAASNDPYRITLVVETDTGESMFTLTPPADDGGLGTTFVNWRRVSPSDADEFGDDEWQIWNAIESGDEILVMVHEGTADYADPTLPVADAPAVSIGSVDTGDSGTDVELSATVSGGTYDELDYAWVVSGGTLDDATAESPTWTRPANSGKSNALYDIDLTVTARGTGTNAGSGTSDTASATRRRATVFPVPGTAEQSWTLGAVTAVRDAGDRITELLWDADDIPDVQFDDAFKTNASDDRYPTTIWVREERSVSDTGIWLDVGDEADDSGSSGALSDQFERHWEIDFEYNDNKWSFTHDEFTLAGLGGPPYVFRTSEQTTEDRLAALVAAIPNGITGVVVTIRNGPALTLADADTAGKTVLVGPALITSGTGATTPYNKTMYQVAAPLWTSDTVEDVGSLDDGDLDFNDGTNDGVITRIAYRDVADAANDEFILNARLGTNRGKLATFVTANPTARVYIESELGDVDWPLTPNDETVNTTTHNYVDWQVHTESGTIGSDQQITKAQFDILESIRNAGAPFLFYIATPAAAATVGAIGDDDITAFAIGDDTITGLEIA